jgi:hypothetical protein
MQLTVDFGGRECFGFNYRNGHWWGHPADDQAACDELDRLLRKGAEYVVVASSAYWYLDYYKCFSERLRSLEEVLDERDTLVLRDSRSRR